MGIESAITLPTWQLQLVVELIGKHLPGVEVWAYGSRVRGNSRRYSDLDLVVFCGRRQSSQLYSLREAFEESDLPIRVDLFRWDQLPDSFQQQIELEYVTLQHAAKANLPSETR